MHSRVSGSIAVAAGCPALIDRKGALLLFSLSSPDLSTPRLGWLIAMGCEPLSIIVSHRKEL